MNPPAAFTYARTYRGPIRALILDWSGTTVDPYVIAPARVFVEVLRRHGVAISMAEARAPMGVKKEVHLQMLVDDPVIRARWEAVHGRAPKATDVEQMAREFIPTQLECLAPHSGLLPGVAETVRRLQSRGVKVGSTTGFPRAIVDALEAAARTQGYVPDASVAGDDLAHGSRPGPFMLFRCLERMAVSPVHAVLKIDDTTAGIEEGLNAGCWTMGVARYSNYMNVNSLEEAAALRPAEIASRLARTREILGAAGAHYVVDSLADIEPVIADLEARLGRGEKP